MKQKTLIPLIVFLLGICLVGIILYKVDSHETAQNHTTALLNATTYGERIKNEITEGIDVTDVLKQILISESGEFNQFDIIAENLMSDSIESVQLAPNGVVTDIYPSAGNEAGKIDLLHDKDRGKISGNRIKEQRMLLYLPSSSFTISTTTTQIITGRMIFAPFFTAKPAPM